MKNDWIMVVDDDALSLQNARNLLEENHMRVSTASSGRELLAFMEKSDPDLILLDVLMPEMDGFETYRLLREYEEYHGRRATPVIFLTGDNDTTAERRGLTMGASDYVKKPFNRDILLRRIHNTIQNSRTIESLTEEATIDKLTGFLNKASTTARMTKLCTESPGMLAILDLDSFKLVNDLFGHDMGDRVLKAFAETVQHNTRADDVRCRIGGDEFMVYFRNAVDKKALTALSQRLNTQLVDACKRLMGEDFGIPIGVSMGAVPVPEHGGDYEQLFPLADKALYQVKQNGKHGCAIYDAGLGADENEAEAETPERELARLTQIMEERGGGGNGAMWLGQDAFSSVYRYVVRSMKRSGGTAAKLLFVLKETGGGGELSAAADEFGDLLSGMLRAQDVIFQSRPTQFFLLLPEQSRESAEEAVGRILDEWRHTPYHEHFTVTHVLEELRFERTDDPLKNIPGISYDTGLEYCGSQKAFFELLDMFRQSIEKDADAIERCRVDGDIRNYTIKVHALKSAARMIGAAELSELAKELEAAGNAGDAALIDEKTPELLAQYRGFAEKLRPLFETAAEDAREPIDAKTLAETYAAIAECAAMTDYDMTEAALDSLNAYRLPPEDEARVGEIRSALLELDWERVAALCKR